MILKSANRFGWRIALATAYGLVGRQEPATTAFVCESDGAIATYRFGADTLDADTSFVADKYGGDLAKECFFRIGKTIFGAGGPGRNAFYHLRRAMRNFKMDVNKGAQYFHDRYQEFQTYLPHCPWRAGERRGEQPTRFTELEARENYFGALQQAQMGKLAEIGHDVLKTDSLETISKLVALEDGLKKEIAREKQGALPRSLPSCREEA